MAAEVPLRTRRTLLRWKSRPPGSVVAARRPAADRRLGYLLVAPVVILLLLVTAYPLLYNLWNSFHFVNLSFGGLPHKFVGGQDYTKMFTSSAWLAALERTLSFTVVSVVLDTIAAIGLALMLHRKFRGRGVLRAAVLIPWAVPTVVSAMLWKTMFDPRSGFVDYFLGAVHPSWANLTWLNASVWRSWSVIFIADAWKNVPFIAIILLAGLQVIPTDIYEAAKIDGASSLRAFRRLTLPLLKPALMVALIFRTLSAFLVFDVVYIMSNGGPGTSTETLAYLDFNAFHVDDDYGYGGAISLVLIVLCLLIAAAYTRVFRERT